MTNKRIPEAGISLPFLVELSLSPWHSPSSLVLLLLLLGAVFRSTLLPRGNAGSIEDAAHNVIADAWEVLHTATANHHDRVFLEIVPFAWDIGCHFHSVRETDTGDFSHSRVRLLRRHGCHLQTNTAFVRAIGLGDAILNSIDDKGHRRRLRLLPGDFAGALDELIDRSHKGKSLLGQTKKDWCRMWKQCIR